MPATEPPPPLHKRVPPGVWVALAWCAGELFTRLARVRLPGEIEPEEWPAAQLYRWEGLVTLVLATALAMNGGRLLSRKPLAALACLLTAAGLATTALGGGEIPMAQFLAPTVALYFIAASQARRTAVIALAMALGTLVEAGWPCGC